MTPTKFLPSDEKLPTLAGVLATYPQAEVVKYSPQKRCIVRVVREGRTCYAKVYPSKFIKRGRGEGINETGKAFWSLTEAGLLNFRVPRPLGWNSVSQTIWNEELPGIAAVEKLKSQEGENIAFKIGKAVALIALSGIAPKRIFDYAEQLADADEFADITTQRFPELTTVVKSVRISLDRADRPTQKLAPIHGDMHIDQWLANENDLGLLDFEDFALGHPERDLGFFMVQLEAVHGCELDHKSLNAQVLRGYRSAGLRPNERLTRIYSAHKWFSKASKAGSSIQARELLDRAAICLND